MKVGDILKKGKPEEVMVGTAKVMVSINGKPVSAAKIAEIMGLGSAKAQAPAPAVAISLTPEQIAGTPEAHGDLAYNLKLKKANMETRLRKLATDGKRVSFLVLTPGSSDGRPVQSVILVNFEVKKTADGNVIVCGRDIEHEILADLEAGIAVERHVPTASRAKEDCVIRSYRLDRILSHTMMWN